MIDATSTYTEAGGMARELELESMVRGYHMCKGVWCAAVGEELSRVREVNYRYPLAVAVMRSGVVVSHIPRKILSICSIFLKGGFHAKKFFI